ncbi:MAG: fasciclin domain-containing protein [Sediminibacterium sp.]
MKLLQQLKWSLCAGFLVLGLFACKKQQFDLLTTTDVNIVDYLRKSPDQYSELVKALEKTNISPFLNAYGTYTLFAPTNDAFKIYLKEIGKNSVDEVDETILRDLLRLHIISDTVRSTSFTDGKLYAPTMQGQFLTTGVVPESGATVINRQALALQLNMLTGNGYVHTVDHLLQPATLTLAKQIEGNTKYSIITQALKETGWFDSLNTIVTTDTTRRWRTFLLESDSVLKVAGFPTYASFKAKYSNTGNPKLATDSLNLYIAYHMLYDIKYIADIVSFTSHNTYAPQQVVTQLLEGQSVLLNQATFNNVFESGILMNRASSDIPATNGVLHNLNGQLLLKKRDPFRVDFDIAAQPEIIKLTSIYRKVGKSQTFALGQLKDVTWQNVNSTPQYSTEGPTTSNQYWWDDHFDFNMRFGNAAANNWIEFKTPLIVKGKYKVWVCFRRASVGQYIQLSFDGNPTPKLINLTSALNGALAGPALEATDYKRYTIVTTSNNYAMMAGVIDVATTDRHTLRFTCVRDQGSGANNTSTVDFVQFIPIDQDQLRPLYGRDGTILP